MIYICNSGDELTDAMLQKLLEHIAQQNGTPPVLLISDVGEGGKTAADIPESDALIILYDDENDPRYVFSHTHFDRMAAFGAKYRAVRRAPIDLQAFSAAAREIIAALPETESASGGIVYTKRRIEYLGKTATLTEREDELFRVLFEHSGELVSREDLVAAVWGENTSTNVADVYVSYLRRKLTPLFGDGVLPSVRGAGYILHLNTEQ